jgi:ethanolamine utilization protein EutP (predicted NTPase)
MLIVWAILRVVEGDTSYEMKVYQESPGVYFEHPGHATLSTTAWTIIVYVPMHTIDDVTSNLKQYVQYIDKTCSRMIIRNWTACSHFGDIMTHKFQQISYTRRLLSDIVQKEDENRRQKRGLFNCLIS